MSGVFRLIAECQDIVDTLGDVTPLLTDSEDKVDLSFPASDQPQQGFSRSFILK